MVSASSTERDGGSPPPPPTPPLSESRDVNVPATGILEALRQAVEMQEAHVRLLRARKAAREALLCHIQRLLETGDSIESHDTVVHLVRQAEAAFHNLQLTEKEVDAPAAAMGDNVTPTSAPSPAPQGADGAASTSADPLARIFHSGVEAQLAAVTKPPDAPLTPALKSYASTKRRTSKGSKKREAGEPGMTSPARSSSVPPGMSFPPRSAAVTALLSLSASRQEAGRIAMLAALSALELSLASNSGATEAGRDVQSTEPAWLRPEESDGANGAEAEPEEELQRKDNGRCDSASVDYSDDFECGNSSGRADDDEEEPTEMPS
ncbi:hypothetical protein JIQ42_06496 [Leishmania sp. Namibia]|uniref:hypothetical protein n=1 Tax=Leishmania sp. Namibia TaxID=2802991 RepID=UPI001B441C6A|nr:hypothetical protein JIQ42_06496 [Leishmania sp. Namibia]